MHWADALAKKLAHRGQNHVIAAGITPSGVFHVGHLREILTGEILHRACTRAGLESEFVFIVDSADPLRKVYEFLGDGYEQYIGHQLAEIPAPDENGQPGDGSTSYAEHFLQPFLASLEQIGVRPRLIDNHASYAEGRFADCARIACESAAEIREILERISGRELDEDWFPYNPIGSDGSMLGVRVTGFEWPYVSWIDACGVGGHSDIRSGEGKLPWRIDWPARWSWIGVTCEPFGKDHGASGGSYSTARPIAELFGHQPPMPLTYEWISLKGVGAMSSSSGVSIGPMEVLELVPPEVLRYLIARSKPSRHLEFDCGEALFNLADEYERVARKVVARTDEQQELSKRQIVLKAEAEGAIRYSAIEDEVDLRVNSVPFRHLVMLAQIRAEDRDVWAALKRDQYIESLNEPPQRLVVLLARIRNWLNSVHFPSDMRIEIPKSPAAGFADQFEFDVVHVLNTLLQELNECDWDAESINSAIMETASQSDTLIKHVYRLLYTLILGRSGGPRLAPLLAEMENSRLTLLLQAALSEAEA